MVSSSVVRWLFTISTIFSCQFVSIGQNKESTLNKCEKDISIISGLWVPTGNSSILGVHPTVGFKAGSVKGKWVLDFLFESKFFCSSSPYHVLYNDSVLSTNNLGGGFLVGIYSSFDLSSSLSSSLYCFGSFGEDIFPAINKNPPKWPNQQNITSPSISLGLGRRILFKSGGYYCVEAGYNFVSYKNNGGTSLSGNTISFRFSYGVFRKDNKPHHVLPHSSPYKNYYRK